MNVIHEKKEYLNFWKLLCTFIVITIIMFFISVATGSFLDLFYMVYLHNYNVDFMMVNLHNMPYTVLGITIGLLIGMNINRNIFYSYKIVCKEINDDVSKLIYGLRKKIQADARCLKPEP